MLQSLHVKNLAIIEEAEMVLPQGLTVLTGETGAGKSLLIGSVNLALGAKARGDMVGHGGDSAYVELVFDVEDERTKRALEEKGLDLSENQVVISRRISTNGRSVCRLNDETVTAGRVREIAGDLLDIHGQHEHQSLLHKQKHLEIVDAYGKNQELLLACAKAYEDWKESKALAEEQEIPEDARIRELSFLEFEAEEITQAAIGEGEEEEVFRRFQKVSHEKKIQEGISKILQCVGGGEEEEGASTLLTRALREMGEIAPYDEGLKEYQEMLLETGNLLEEFTRETARYGEALQSDPEEYRRLEERLDLIHRMKEKYGATSQEREQYLEKTTRRIQELKEYASFRQKRKEQLEIHWEEYSSVAEKLHNAREKVAKKLSQAILEGLLDLNFLGVDFAIQSKPAQMPGPKGMDDLEFLISTNPGEEKKPLGQVASGGELSRIMLVIKSILAEQDAVDTLIFDEIDTGISGITAGRVAEKLKSLSKAHQVVCISHLQQIAAAADCHLCVEKALEGEGTKVQIQALDQEGSIRELARMLSGEQITQATLQTARELKEKAAKQG